MSDLNAAGQPLHAGAIVTTSRARYVLNGVRHRTLPKSEWTHGAHLAFGCALLEELDIQFTGDGNLDQETHAQVGNSARDLIRPYNVATGVKNTDTDGYHHTLTLFFLHRIFDFLAALNAQAPDEMDLGKRVTAILSSPLAQSSYPLTYYSKERLFSIAARHGWLAPDLKPLR